MKVRLLASLLVSSMLIAPGFAQTTQNGGGWGSGNSNNSSGVAANGGRGWGNGGGNNNSGGTAMNGGGGGGWGSGGSSNNSGMATNGGGAWGNGGGGNNSGGTAMNGGGGGGWGSGGSSNNNSGRMATSGGGWGSGGSSNNNSGSQSSGGSGQASGGGNAQNGGGDGNSISNSNSGVAQNIGGTNQDEHGGNKQVSFLRAPPASAWRASRLMGMPVYGSHDLNIGEVNDILIKPNGQIDALVVGIGGFLGIGEKNIGIPFSVAQWREEGRAGSKGPNGYTGPVRMLISLTKTQVQGAPYFQYVSTNENDGGARGSKAGSGRGTANSANASQ